MLLFGQHIRPVAERVEEMRTVKLQAERPEVSAFHLHPKDVGGAIVSIDEMRHRILAKAGLNWQANRSRLVGDLQSVSIEVKTLTNSRSLGLAARCSCRTDGDSPLILKMGKLFGFCPARVPPRGLCAAKWRWLGSRYDPAPQIFCGVELSLPRHLNRMHGSVRLIWPQGSIMIPRLACLMAWRSRLFVR